MVAEGQPTRRLSRRARIAMLLFVLPALIFSASTRSSDTPQDAKATAADARNSAAIKGADERAVYSVVYSVRDLLNPIRRNSGQVTVADFETLMDRIKQRAAPGTWGDAGEIQPLPNNLSVVISHNAGGHTAVQAFLTELRESALGATQ